MIAVDTNILVYAHRRESRHHRVAASIMRGLAERAKAGAAFSEAPQHAPRRRLDETRAARRPVLRWRPAEAAEPDGPAA